MESTKFYSSYGKDRLDMRKVFLLILLFFGCKKNNDPFTKVLTNEKSNWVFYNYPDEQINGNIIITSYSNFYQDRTFKSFYNDKKHEETFTGVESPESSKNHVWSYNPTDSVFTLGGSLKFKILKFNSDTITFKNDKNHIEKLVRLRL